MTPEESGYFMLFLLSQAVWLHFYCRMLKSRNLYKEAFWCEVERDLEKERDNAD